MREVIHYMFTEEFQACLWIRSMPVFILHTKADLSRISASKSLLGTRQGQVSLDALCKDGHGVHGKSDTGAGGMAFGSR